MVLELIVIGGAIYYYVRKNKQEKAKKAAFAAGQPWTNKDGTVTYPPNYPGLPGLPAYSAGDFKRQNHEFVQQQQQQPNSNVPREYYYSDAPSPQPRAAPMGDEKAPLAIETREVFRDEKR